MPEPIHVGRLALVTGASGLIGSAIAQRLAQDGAAVLVHFNSDHAGAEGVVAALHSAGGMAEAIEADLSQKDGALGLLSKLDAAFEGRYAGRLDILVNNAGIFDAGIIADITDEAFDRTFTVNVRSMFQLSRDASTLMARRGWVALLISARCSERQPTVLDLLFTVPASSQSEG